MYTFTIKTEIKSVFRTIFCTGISVRTFTQILFKNSVPFFFVCLQKSRDFGKIDVEKGMEKNLEFKWMGLA